MRYAKREKLDNALKVIGKARIASSENRVIAAKLLKVPEVTLAGYTLNNVPALLAAESNAEAKLEHGVIGIGLQSRFDFVIDYPNSKMYLMPNTNFNNAFAGLEDTPFNFTFLLSGAFGILVLVYFIYRLFKRKPATTS